MNWKVIPSDLHLVKSQAAEAEKATRSRYQTERGYPDQSNPRDDANRASLSQLSIGSQTSGLFLCREEMEMH